MLFSLSLRDEQCYAFLRLCPVGSAKLLQQGQPLEPLMCSDCATAPSLSAFATRVTSAARLNQRVWLLKLVVWGHDMTHI